MEALAHLPPHDAETETDLAALRATLRRHWRAGTAWEARDALDVIATLDLPAWATLLGLIAECPVALATIETAGRPRPRTVDPSAFVFISERAQIDAVATFLDTLPEALRGLARVLPLTYAVSLLRGIWHGDGWLAHASDVGILALMFVACLALSTRLFRWE